MMRVWEVPVFFGAALALHAAAFLAIPGKGQDGAPGGDGGTATVTVAAASPQLAAMVEAWETPPDVAGPPVPEVTEAPAPAAPARPEVATAPPPAAVPEPPVPAAPMAADLPDLPGLPQMPEDRAAEPEPEPEPENVAEAEPDVEAEAEAEAEPEPEPPTALAEAERPAPRPAEMAAVTPPADPEPQPERAAPSPQEAQPELRAAGTAGGEARGQAGQAEVATASPGQQADLMAIWGAQIQERLQRALVYPRQAQMRRLTGAATVALTVGADGRVQGRRLVASSGSPILDEAALSTVDRARGIPQAPQALGGGSFTFQLPVRFDGR